MTKLLIIPKQEQIDIYLNLAKEWDAGFEYNDFFNPELLDNKEELEKRIAFYQRNRVDYSTMHGVFFDIIVASYDAKIKTIAEDRMRESLNIATRLGAKKVVFHTNLDPSLPQSYYLENWLKKNIAFYKALAYEYPNIEIVIENMFDKNPYQLKKLVEGIAMPNVKVCLDLAHAYLSGTPIEHWIQELKPYISHIHVNDNDGIVDSHMAIGDGTMDYSSLIPFLKGFTGTVLIEVSTIEKLITSYTKLKEYGLL